MLFPAQIIKSSRGWISMRFEIEFREVYAVFQTKEPRNFTCLPRSRGNQKVVQWSGLLQTYVCMNESALDSTGRPLCTMLWMAELNEPINVSEWYVMWYCFSLDGGRKIGFTDSALVLQLCRGSRPVRHPNIYSNYRVFHGGVTSAPCASEQQTESTIL
jgi:hypothetical protein